MIRMWICFCDELNTICWRARTNVRVFAPHTWSYNHPLHDFRVYPEGSTRCSACTETSRNPWWTPLQRDSVEILLPRWSTILVLVRRFYQINSSGSKSAQIQNTKASKQCCVREILASQIFGKDFTGVCFPPQELWGDSGKFTCKGNLG